MTALFLTTFLSCQQLYGILLRVQKNSILTAHQKEAIMLELRKAVPTCPVIVKNYDRK